MTGRPTALVLAAAIAAAAALAGCGSGGDKRTIPRDDAARLVQTLRDARDAAGDPDKCDDLQQAVRRARAQVAALPARVDEDTRKSLVNGVGNLDDEARQDCEDTQTTDTTPTDTTPTATTAPPVETVPPPTETTPTETTPTETTPTETTPTETQPTVTEPPPTVPGNGNGGVPPGQEGKGGPKDTPGQPKHGKDKKPKKENHGK